MNRLLHVAFTFVLVASVSAQSPPRASNPGQAKAEAQALIAAAGKGDLLQVQQLLKRGSEPKRKQR